MRDKGPCAPFAGLRDQLRAAASRHWPVLLVFSGMPAWAAAGTPGCRRGASPTAAGPPPAALTSFRQLVRDVRFVAAGEGADLRYISPWNEPNHPYFLAPQRASCDPAAPTLAAAAYARLAEAVRAELGDGQELVLGETAGLLE